MPRASTFDPQPSTLNRFRAFTLIELLVVMAVIGVLAALLLPVVGAVKKKQYIYNTQAEMAKIETAIDRYKAAYGFYPQSPTNPPTVSNPSTSSTSSIMNWWEPFITATALTSPWMAAPPIGCRPGELRLSASADSSIAPNPARVRTRRPPGALSPT